MKTYLLPEDVRTAILAYLAGRPYGEVFKGVAMLQGLEEVEAEEKQGPMLKVAEEAQKEG